MDAVHSEQATFIIYFSDVPSIKTNHTPAPKMIRKRLTHYLCLDLVLVLLSATLWLPALLHVGLLSDDHAFVEVWGMPGNALRWLHTEYTGFFRPLSALFWKANFQLWGSDGFGYHLANLALHVTCTVLSLQVARHFFPGNRQIGTWAALLFMFLPGHIFAVLSPSASPGLLCSVFVLSTVLLHLRNRLRGLGWQSLPLLILVLALLSKELALTTPLLILFVNLIWPVDKSARGRHAFRFSLPYFAMVLAYLARRYWLFGHLTHSPLAHTNVDPYRLFINGGIYTLTAFAPWGLEGFKPFFRANPQMLFVMVAVAFGIILIFVWHFRRHIEKGHVYCVLWIAITTMPVVRLYSPWNTYLPSVGSAIVTAALLHTALRARPTLRAATFLVVLFTCMFYSMSHVMEWRKASSLSQRCVAEVIRVYEETDDRVYLTHIPVELGDAPVFGGPWGLYSALSLKGYPSDRLTILSLVRIGEDTTNIDARMLKSGDIELFLTTPHGLFRIESNETVTHQRTASIGYRYDARGNQFEVISLNDHGEPNGLRIALAGNDKPDRVYLWRNNGLKPLSIRAK